jgi:hypothetical protein
MLFLTVDDTLPTEGAGDAVARLTGRTEAFSMRDRWRNWNWVKSKSDERNEEANNFQEVVWKEKKSEELKGKW